MSFDAFTVYERYLDRAKRVVVGPPFNCDIAHEDTCRLTVDGTEAVLMWTDISSGYYGDSPDVDTKEYRFTTALLTMSETEFKAWKQAHQLAAARERELAAETRRKQEARRERAEYDRLKQKFGG